VALRDSSFDARRDGLPGRRQKHRAQRGRAAQSRRCFLVQLRVGNSVQLPSSKLALVENEAGGDTWCRTKRWTEVDPPSLNFQLAGWPCPRKCRHTDQPTIFEVQMRRFECPGPSTFAARRGVYARGIGPPRRHEPQHVHCPVRAGACIQLWRPED
jgi:hypothetical protein